MTNSGVRGYLTGQRSAAVTGCAKPRSLLTFDFDKIGGDKTSFTSSRRYSGIATFRLAVSSARTAVAPFAI
jgi:hypothetical protein